MKPKLLILFIDAFQFNYHRSMPKLRALSQNGQWGSLIPEIGFASRMGSFFTGLPPDQNGLFTTALCSYSSDSRWIYPFVALTSPIAKLHPQLNKLTRLGLYSFFNAVNLLRGHHYFAYFKQIPLDLIPYTEIAMKKHYCEPVAFSSDNLFDYFRARKLNYKFYMWPFRFNNHHLSLDLPLPQTNSDQYRYRQFSNMINGQADIYYAQFFNLDSAGHRFGIGSSELNHEIAYTDNLIKDLVTRFRSHHPQGHVLIWTDHGMTQVQRTLDVISLINSAGFKLVTDYLCFVDATLIRIWPKSSRIKRKFQQLLQHPHLIELTKKHRDRYHLNFPNNLHGELIYQATAGTLFHPNYYDNTTPPRAMHGYLPETKSEWGYYSYFGNSAPIGKQQLHTRDLFQLIRTNLNYL